MLGMVRRLAEKSIISDQKALTVGHSQAIWKKVPTVKIVCKVYIGYSLKKIESHNDINRISSNLLDPQGSIVEFDKNFFGCGFYYRGALDK